VIGLSQEVTKTNPRGDGRNGKRLRAVVGGHSVRVERVTETKENYDTGKTQWVSGVPLPKNKKVISTSTPQTSSAGEKLTVGGDS